MAGHTPKFSLSTSRYTMALLVASTAPFAAHAFQFSNEADTVNGSFDTTISLGTAFRAHPASQQQSDFAMI